MTQFWQIKFATLAPGLTAAKAARVFRRPYQTVRRYGMMFGYRFTDGRKFKRPQKINPLRVDWSRPNIEIARRFKVSRERVRVLRKRLGL